jgi:excisionase family DNA binding protein
MSARQVDQTPRLYRPEEVAFMLGIGRTKVYELIATGQLDSVKIGASRRVASSAIEELVAGLQAQGAW